MTALENVLVGMHVPAAAGLVGRRAADAAAAPEEAALDQPKRCELLELRRPRRPGDELARNLPYGDQRRLEIARALASEPEAPAARRAHGRDEPAETRRA